MSQNLPPSAAEVESLAEEMVALKGKIADVYAKAEDEIKLHSERLDELRTLAEDWIRKFGSAHAEKSKILRGILYEIMGTFGTSMSIDAAAVETFRLALVKAKQARLLKKIFEKAVRFDLKPGHAEIIQGVKLKDKLLALYARCTVSTPRTPVITPRLKKEEKAA